MRAFHTGGDRKRLYFADSGNDFEEYNEIVRSLTKAGAELSEKVEGPYCDLIHCSLKGKKFDIMRYIDGDGNFLYSEDERCMKALEELFGLSERQ